MAEAELPDGLRKWAALSGPAAVLDAVRRRARRGGQLETGSLRVPLTAEQRRQVARLLGTNWEISGRAVTLRALDGSLADHGFTVRRFIEMLDGAPLIADREIAAEAELIAAREQRLVVRTLTDAGVPVDAAEAWLGAAGTPRPGAGRTAALAADIATVWPELPWSGPPVRLARLAARTRGNAHHLDYSTDLGRAVARLIAAATGTVRPTRPGRDWRAAWAAAGVRCDTVSSRVLVLNLPLDITAGSRGGVPRWLTLRDTSGPWNFSPPPSRLYVCENPTIVEAAADELGPACPPLICTDGVPSLAALDLVAAAAHRGIEVYARADIDRTGFTILHTLEAAAPELRSWRFDAATYARHRGIPAADQPLAVLHAGNGEDVHEEALLPLLLDDLRAAAGGSHGETRGGASSEE